MAKLAYKTKGDSSPQGKERVYFSCHPDDFNVYFEPICRDIFWTQDCVIYYNSEQVMPWDKSTMDLELKHMQLFVIPVTYRFLYQDNAARSMEFIFAIKQHIPILPLMQENGLDSEFNRICGNIQFLNKKSISNDPTVTSYEEKLEKFLSAVLLGDELTKKVRAAFKAWMEKIIGEYD